MIRLGCVPPRNGIVANTVELFRRTVESRCSERVNPVEPAGANVVFDIRPGGGVDGFAIQTLPNGVPAVVGNDERGLLYGVGKFLRKSRYLSDRFVPAPWRGVSVPQRELRGIYFATHFHNYYHLAPVEEVNRYIEELALWGVNLLMVWFDFHHFNGMEDPAAQPMLARLRSYLQTAKSVGMKAALGVIANEGYANSPEQLRIPKTCGAYGVELCPNKPGALEVLGRSFEQLFGAFRDIGLDLISIWPYDQGSCSCAACWPWGANGYLKAARPIGELARRIFPDAKVVLSTWYFDNYIKNNVTADKTCREGEEWEGLVAAFKSRPNWCDYILVDEVSVAPKRLLQDGVTPGGLPLINFPEISMRGMLPWGGFGANPQPAYLPPWRNNEHFTLAGGYAYSEGVYEDINKAMVAQFYWNDSQDSLETVREYAGFEFGEEVADDIVKAAALLEKTMFRRSTITDGVLRFIPDCTEHVSEAWRIIKGADRRLSSWARKSWRWRVLYLRACIDAQLLENDFIPTTTCDEAFEELGRLYHANESTLRMVAPPARKRLGAKPLTGTSLFPWAGL